MGFGSGLHRLIDNDLSRHASWYNTSSRIDTGRRYNAWELQLADGPHAVGTVRLHHTGDFGGNRFDVAVEVRLNGQLVAQCGVLPRTKESQTVAFRPEWVSFSQSVPGSEPERPIDSSAVEEALWRTEVPEVDCAGAMGDSVLVVYPWGGTAQQLTITEVQAYEEHVRQDAVVAVPKDAWSILRAEQPLQLPIVWRGSPTPLTVSMHRLRIGISAVLPVPLGRMIRVQVRGPTTATGRPCEPISADTYLPAGSRTRTLAQFRCGGVEGSSIEIQMAAGLRGIPSLTVTEIHLLGDPAEEMGHYTTGSSQASHRLSMRACNHPLVPSKDFPGYCLLQMVTDRFDPAACSSLGGRPWYPVEGSRDVVPSSATIGLAGRPGEPMQIGTSTGVVPTWKSSFPKYITGEEILTAYSGSDGPPSSQTSTACLVRSQHVLDPSMLVVDLPPTNGTAWY